MWLPEEHQFVAYLKVRVENLKEHHSDVLQAYVLRVLMSYLNLGTTAQKDLSHESLVLYYARICERPDFIAFQSLGDWLLFSHSIFPAYDKENRKVTLAIGQRSYDACWRFTRKEIGVYEELADCLPAIVRELNRKP